MYLLKIITCTQDDVCLFIISKHKSLLCVCWSNINVYCCKLNFKLNDQGFFYDLQHLLFITKIKQTSSKKYPSSDADSNSRQSPPYSCTSCCTICLHFRMDLPGLKIYKNNYFTVLQYVIDTLLTHTRV